MKRGRLPLTALRSFEAAGRLGSFTLAAAELFVSQAAISRQIRELEALLGSPLFDRGHRSVTLTPAGARLLSSLTPAFDTVAAALDEIAAGSIAQSVKVSVEPAFASAWLVPNLPDFQRRFPEIDVIIDSDPRPIEFHRNDAEIAIRHSLTATSWPRTQSRGLAGCDVTPALSPGLTPCLLREPRDLIHLPMLHEEDRDLWNRWFAAAGAVGVTAPRGPILTDAAMVLQATLRGQGVGLVDLIFLREDLAAGRLIRPFAITIPCGAYWIVARDLDRLSPAAAAFVDWLTHRIGPPA